MKNIIKIKTKKWNWILFVAFVLSQNITIAQVSVTPFIGLNFSKIVNFDDYPVNSFTDDYSLNIPSLTIEAARKLSESSELGLGVSYKRTNFSKKLIEGQRADIDRIDYSLAYIDFSIRYNLLLKYGFYLSNGFSLNYLINENTKTFERGQIFKNSNTIVFQKRDLGPLFGLGCSYKKIDFRITYYIGLSKLDRNGSARIFQLIIGYKI